MAQDRPGAGAAAGGTTVVIPGEMAARVDRLPVSGMAWELALLAQGGRACAASADGLSARPYPFSALAGDVMTAVERAVLSGLECGIRPAPYYCAWPWCSATAASCTAAWPIGSC